MTRFSLRLSGCLLVLLGLMLLPACTHRRPKPAAEADTHRVAAAVTPITSGEFARRVFDFTLPESQQRFLGSKPVLVDFYATWCGPCRRLAPEVEAVAQRYAGQIDVYKVDVDVETDVASAYAINSIPALLFVDAQGNKRFFEGYCTRVELTRMVSQFLLGESR